MEILFIKEVITKEESIAPQANLSAWYIDTNLPPVGAWELAALDWGNRADITIIITAATNAAAVSGTIVAGEAIITVDSIIFIVVFIGWPSAQEASCRRVFLSRLIAVLLFWGGVVPFLGHIVIIVFIFQFPIKEELEVLAIGQGLIVLWSDPEVPLLCVPVQRSASLVGGLGVELRGHLLASLRFDGEVGRIRGWRGYCRRRMSRIVQLLSAWGRGWMHCVSMRD
jgi:hypothetical protein